MEKQTIKKQIIEAIKEERAERLEKINRFIIVLLLVLTIITIVATVFLFVYNTIEDIGYRNGLDEGWDNANQGIIKNIEEGNKVGLFWSNDSFTGIAVMNVNHFDVCPNLDTKLYIGGIK